MSGTGQVISLDVRSNLVSGDGVFEQEGYTGPQQEGDGEKQEIDYCSVLNRNLPEVRLHRIGQQYLCVLIGPHSLGYPSDSLGTSSYQRLQCSV